MTTSIENAFAARPDEVRSAEHFDAGADQYAAAYDEQTCAGHSFRARRSKAKELLGAGPLGDLLDVGGASGVYFDALKSQVRSYHIVDVSPLMIEHAEKIKSGGVPLSCRVASIYDLPYQDNSFDTVIAMGVLEYLDDPWKGLTEMARVAKPGGVILVSYPNIQSPMRRMSHALYRLFARRTSPFAPTLVFSADQVRKAVSALELQEAGMKGYNAQLMPFPLTWRMRWLAYHLAIALEPMLGKIGNLWGTSFIVKSVKVKS